MASGEQILIVESDPDIADLIGRQSLQPLGYQVTVVGDAASAIKYAIQTTPSLILATSDASLSTNGATQDITVGAAITWATANILTLTAGHNILSLHQIRDIFKTYRSLIKLNP